MSSSKEIEDKAINHLRLFLEDSDSLSPFIAENDKGPCWDGYIIVYKKGYRDNKKYLIEQVLIQVKGKEVYEISDKCKYPIAVTDLKAYLHNPTLFIVCQIHKKSQERKLFYISLLPEAIKHLLKGRASQYSVTVNLKPMPDLHTFEDYMMIFIGDKRKQMAFADKNTLSMKDVISRGIKNFSFVAPRKMDSISLIKYMSSHFSYLYAQIDKDLNIEVPIADGPAKMIFETDMPLSVCADNRVFYESCHKKIENGICTLTAGNFMTIEYPIGDICHSFTMKINSKADLLDEKIKEEEFVLAILKTKQISIGEVDFEVNGEGNVDDIQNRINFWKDIKELLNVLHVKKQLSVNEIKGNQWLYIKILIKTIIYKTPVQLSGQKSTPINFEFGNLHLLIWCIVNKNDWCMFGDYFDGTCDLICQVRPPKGKPLFATVYSYLRKDKLWEVVDNIDFEQIVPKTKALLEKNEQVYEIANQDALSMIIAADNLLDKDTYKTKLLLSKAKELTEWCYENDIVKNKVMYKLNIMQIIKRERDFNNDETNDLLTISDSESETPIFRLAASMLLGDKKRYEALKPIVDKEDLKMLQTLPIWKYTLEDKI